MKPSAPSRAVSLAEASQIVRWHADRLAETGAPSEQTVPLLDSLGRVLAKPIRADRDQPPFSRSTRDGFACRAADLNAGQWLKVVGRVRAGEVWAPAARSQPPRAAKTAKARRAAKSTQEEAEAKLAQGQAVEIMTGAPVPAGADCVVMLEHVEQAEQRIRLSGKPISAGANIVPVGAEARAGESVVPAGCRIAAAQIAAAAACGAAELRVFARPRVAILATGDELVDVNQRPLAYQIRNSNGYSLAAQVLAGGGEPLRLALARDDARQIETRISAALAFDLLLVSGGVSMGKYDLVEEVLLSMGAEFFFTGALIQPGKPIVFGKIVAAGKPRYFFGLPGNPVSTMVTFLLFVAPLLGALGGQPSCAPRFVQAKLAGKCQRKAGITRFVPSVLRSGIARTEVEPMAGAMTEPVVEPVASQGSGDIAAMSRANCFLMVPPGRSSLEAGESVTVLL